MGRDEFEITDGEVSLLGGLVSLLEEWAEWQSGYAGVRGYPGRSAMLSGTGSQTFDDLCADADDWKCKVIDACIDDLLPAQRAAVMRRYGVAAVFRFPRLNYAELLSAAHDSLLLALPRRGVVVPERRA